jgi:hypothetical protein
LTPDKREEYADTVIEATQKLSLMMTNILKLSKLENQEIYPVPTGKRGCYGYGRVAERAKRNSALSSAGA